MRLVLEGTIPAGGEHTFEVRSTEYFEPEVLHVFVRLAGEPDFVQPFHAGKSHQGIRTDLLYLVTGWLNEHPLMDTPIPDGGLMLSLFEPNGMGAQGGYYNVCEGDVVRVTIRSDRLDDVTLRLVLADEKGEAPPAEPFPSLQSAWGTTAPRDGEMPEYIFGMPATAFARGEEREVAFEWSGDRRARVTFRPQRMIIPSAVGENFEIWDMRVSGESRLGGRLTQAQPCMTFAEWTAVRLFDVGEIREGSVATLVVRRTGGTRETENFMAALMGPVER